MHIQQVLFELFEPYKTISLSPTTTSPWTRAVTGKDTGPNQKLDKVSPNRLRYSTTESRDIHLRIMFILLTLAGCLWQLNQVSVIQGLGKRGSMSKNLNLPLLHQSHSCLSFTGSYEFILPRFVSPLKMKTDGLIISITVAGYFSVPGISNFFLQSATLKNTVNTNPVS